MWSKCIESIFVKAAQACKVNVNCLAEFDNISDVDLNR